MSWSIIRTTFFSLLILLFCATASADPTLKLKVAGGNQHVQPGDVITVSLLLNDLNGQEAAGYQAFLSFDETRYDYIGGVYTSVFGLPIINPILATTNTLDLAAGINPFSNQQPVTGDAVLAVLSFVVLQEATCITSIEFRTHEPPTRVTNPTGEALVPLVLDSLPAEPPTSDINGDGVVNVSDLLLMLAQWGPCVPGETCSADLDCSGIVDVSDLLILLANWG